MSLGNLLEAVWYEHPSRLNLSALNTETLSILGSFTYPSEELEDIAKKIVEDSSVGTPVLKPARRLSISERNRMPLAKAQIFGSMNHLVCGFSSSVVEDILNDDDVAKTLLPIYGRMEVCPSKEALGKIAEAVS